MKSALGKIFDWITTSFKKVATSTINAAKKAVRTIVDAVQSYADKEYNTIQLKVAFGSDFAQVEKGFKDLLKYTTADKNDLWSTIATYAEMGKSAKDALKYARATVYLSNATGKSLETITRMLLMQETLSRDLDRTLAKVGVHVSNAKADMSDIDRIIAGMQEEMEALMSDSLSQKFANVKNAWISIKESIGALFAGPVGYVAEKLADLLSKLDKTIQDGKPLIDKLWENLKPIVDKIFLFFEKFLKDPQGFIDALKHDIQTIVKNFWTNLGNYLKIAGYMIGKAISSVIDAMEELDFKGFESAVKTLGDMLSNFTISVGLGAGWFEEEDVVENSFRKTFINAWNRANEEFKMSADDPWYKNLVQLLKGVWESIKTWWEESSLKKKLTEFWDSFLETFEDKVLPTLVESFKYMGSVLATAINNAIASSETIRKVLNVIPGVNFGSQQELAEKQASLYAKVKDYLPSDWTASDLNYQNLMSSYSKNQTWMYHLLAMVEDAREELTWIRKTDVLEQKEYPSFNDFLTTIDKIWNPVDIVGAVTDANKAFRELDASLGEGLPVIKAEDIKDAVEAGVEEAMAIVLQKTVILPKYSGMSHPGGNGGIADYFADELKFKPYVKGGLAGLKGPELAILGEAGPELVVPNAALKRMTGGGGINSVEGAFLNKQGTWVKDNWVNRMLDDLGIISTDLSLITSDSSWLVDWWKRTEIPEDVGEIKEDSDTQLGFWKKALYKLGDWGKALGRGYLKAWGKLAENGAFGSHMGNIIGGIQNDINSDEGFSIWKAIGHVLEELLPYLQKGLEVIGSLFDEAFDILGNAVSILGERIGKLLLPILEAFVPLMKEIADILVALSPVIESVLQPAITVIASILRALVPILDLLMPAFAGIGAVIQWVSDAISWAIGSFLNWLGDIHIGDWYPFAGAGGNSVKKPTSVKENYNAIMGAYNEAKNNSVTGVTSSVSVAGQTASYSGASHVYITNDFAGAYLVGSDGFRELARIIKNEFEDAGYSRQNL